jgi:hypothetical protein
MVKNIFKIMILTVVLSLGSCATNGDLDDLNDDLDGLQGQLDDLQGQLTKLEQEQQAELTAEIAALQAQIAALEGDTEGLASDYADLLASLEETQEEIAAGAKVFYGSVITDADFTALLTSEATIVTGDVNVAKDSHLTSLVNVALVGGNLVINGVTAVELSALETVSQNLVIEGVNATDATVSLPMLKSVGYNLSITNNMGLISVNIPELLLVNQNVMVSGNEMIASLEMAKLDLVSGNLNVDDEVMYAAGLLAEIDFSATDVLGNVSLTYLGTATVDNMGLSLGEIKGDFYMSQCNTYKFELLGNEIGSVNMERNGYLVDFTTPNLTTINGDLRIYDNEPQGAATGSNDEASGWSELTQFAALEHIAGTVDVSENNFSRIDAFNSVTTVDGQTIKFYNNGNMSLVNIFNSLVIQKAYGTHRIDIDLYTDWFNGFELLSKANQLKLKVEKTRTRDSNYIYTYGDACKIDGFDALVGVTNEFELYFGMATEVNLLPMFVGDDVLKAINEGKFKLNLPEDANVTLCSINAILTYLRDEVAVYNKYDRAWMNPQYFLYDGYPGWHEATQADVDPYFATCN